MLSYTVSIFGSVCIVMKFLDFNSNCNICLLHMITVCLLLFLAPLFQFDSNNLIVIEFL